MSFGECSFGNCLVKRKGRTVKNRRGIGSKQTNLGVIDMIWYNKKQDEMAAPKYAEETVQSLLVPMDASGKDIYYACVSARDKSKHHWVLHRFTSCSGYVRAYGSSHFGVIDRLHGLLVQKDKNQKENEVKLGIGAPGPQAYNQATR